MPALQGPKDELDLKAIARTTGVICKRFAQLPKTDQQYVLQKLAAIAGREGPSKCNCENSDTCGTE